MWLHKIVNEVYLGGKMLDTRPDNDELEQRKQVIHAPLVLNTEVSLYHLLTSSHHMQSIRSYQSNVIAFHSH